uniref:Apyrase n=1 Tax=Caenorhabditis japonica TaxID=281687 RepID=A0A8R1I167_CAEJA
MTTENNNSNFFNFLLLGFVTVIAFYSGTQLNKAAEQTEHVSHASLYSTKKFDDGAKEYSFVLVTDLDHDSKDGKKWRSLVSRGFLKVSADHKQADIHFDQDSEYYIDTNIAAGGRAMELSDLAVFNGKLYSVDDRTGLIYQISDKKAIPWVILNDGPGNVVKGLKGEWLTVKDTKLIVGGLGKEWTTTEGEYVNDHPMWVKHVSANGAVHHENWKDVFIRVRRAAGIEYPGYMIHEAVQWSPIHRKWFFLPRRMSTGKYSEADDESRGTNVMIVGNEELTDFEVVRVGSDEHKTRGFAAFQFVPNTHHQLIVAIKSEEKDGKPVASYASVFDIHGHVILDDLKLHGPHKYEGIAFA